MGGPFFCQGARDAGITAKLRIMRLRFARGQHTDVYL